MDGAVIFYSRQNKRATWRSLIRAKKGDLRRTHSPQIVREFLFFCCFVVCVLSFSFPSCHFAVCILSFSFLFCRFVESKLILYYILFHRSGILCFVVSSFDFVVFLLSLIRERRGALLITLNEESRAKVIAADFSQLTVFELKY